MSASLFRVGAGISIDEEVSILYGADVPSDGAGVSAPPGSIYCRNASGTDGGELYIKAGDADTAWVVSGDTSAIDDELGYIRTFIGKSASGSETPDYSSTNVVADATSLETAIGAIDAEIGAAVTANARTNNAISDQAINLNIMALDDAVGADAEMVSVNYIGVANTVYTNLSNLDAQAKTNADDIAALTTGLLWLSSVKATTADDISAFSGTSVTFSDDLIGITVAEGDRIASTYDNTIYVVASGTWTVAGALTSGDTFFTKYDFVSTSVAETQGASAFTFNGTSLVQIAEFDFETADTINIATGYAAANGTISSSDTVQTAIQKLDGNQQDLVTLSGVAQGSVDLGTFTNSIISDNQTVKAALEEVGAAVETNATDVTNLEAAVGSSTGTAGLTYTEQNYVTDGESLNTSVDNLDIVAGKIRTETEASSITTTATLDSVLVDSYDVVKWLVVATDASNNDCKVAWEIFATHDGTDSADAATVDWTKYAKLRVNTAPTGLDFNVDLNGTTTAQVMRLRVTSTDAVNVKAVRQVL